MVSFDLVGDNRNELVRKRTDFEGAERRAKLSELLCSEVK